MHVIVSQPACLKSLSWNTAEHSLHTSIKPQIPGPPESSCKRSIRCSTRRLPPGKMFASVLLLTETHLYNIRRIPEREGMGYIRYRFAFSAIARITGLFECLLIFYRVQGMLS